MRTLLTSLITILIFTGCTSKYIEPINKVNTSKLILKHKEMTADYHFKLHIDAKLDGSSIKKDMFPSGNVIVSSGNHKLELNITAYYNNYRAKYNESKEYLINFKPNTTYKIIANTRVNTLPLENETGDVIVNFKIVENDIVLVSKNMNLEDNNYRSVSRGQPIQIVDKTNNELAKDVANSVIQSVVIPMMH